MNKPKRARRAPAFRYLACGAAVLMLGAAQDTDADSVFRCVDANGHTEFRQTQCETGSGRRLQVEVPRIGWLKPKTKRAPAPRSSAEQAAEQETADGSLPVAGGERRCWQAEQRLEAIQWRLRKGYRRAEGERLRQQRRQQQAFVSRFCK